MTPGNPFDDDISLLSGDGNYPLSGDGNSPLSEDGNSPHDKDSERPRERKLPQQSPGPSLSSLVSKLAVKTTSSKMTQQPRATQERVTSLSALRKTSGDETTSALASTAARPMTRSQNNVRRKLKLRLPHLPNMNPNSDEISITDSLCSGVLREFANAKALARTTRSKIGSKIAGIEDKIATTGGGGDEVQSASATTTTTTTALADGVAVPSHIKSSAAPTADQLAGRGEVVDVFPDIGFSRLDTNVSSMHTDSSWEANESQDDGHEDILRDIVGDDGHNDNDNEDEARLRRQERKERVRERLERYKRDHGQLRSTCMALESALAKTSEKLREVDSRAASKIEALESELRGAREGDETMRINQETCIKELGKKLIRQAHVIKKQRDAVERYKMQLEAMTEELAMQDERDMMREEDVRRLEDLLENSRDRQEQMQTMLQNNIEGMVELKCEVERSSKNIMELEYNLGQKEAMLNRVARDQAEKTERLCELEQVLEDKTFEVESLKKQLDESKESVEAMRQQLEAASKEVEDIKCKFSGWGTSKVDGEAVGDVAAVGRSPHSWRRASIDKIDKSSLLAEDDDIENNMKEAFASELQAKDATIQTLDDACKEKDAMINTVRSDMVKMTSTYKQDSYLKRKEIAKLKQQNAEYALKLRALEKAFQCVNATESMSAVATKDGTKFLAHSAHGGGGERGNKWEMDTASLHGKSVHLASRDDKDGMAAAVSARLGGLRLGRLRDSKVVQEANFFDDDGTSSYGASENGSRSGGKGEDPEEC